MRRFDGDRLIIASHNPGKLREIAALLAGRGITAISAHDLGLAEPAETADSFIGNAALKAQAAVAAGLPALADDSGLAVEALDGAPGIYSARWAGPGQDFALAMEQVNAGLMAKDTPRQPASRRARFVCALALAWPADPLAPTDPLAHNDHLETVEGVVEGSLIWPPRGDRGFGYDPIFVPAGHAESFAEMDPAHKHAISHRAAAFKKLLAGPLRDSPLRDTGQDTGP